jgi:hypothetical protein
LSVAASSRLPAIHHHLSFFTATSSCGRSPHICHQCAARHASNHAWAQGTRARTHPSPPALAPCRSGMHAVEESGRAGC